ncbi:MAG: homoserine dehydrogenase [Firmicutes bacterium]|nr:homoserine dehydrogenase [[Eubacterium] siraeum]MCM1487822.1 homoserine dehydrogenase [Bacillota bacterium]
MIKIAVMGYGVVGSGTVEVFYKNLSSIETKIGDDIDIKYILDLRDFDDSPYKDKFIKDFNLILNDPEITVVVEVIGGLNPAYNYVKSLLEAEKSVVTSNKELVAEKGAELLRIAREKKVNFFFEASVGGGIPIIRPLHHCLSANEIDEIAGILNGTTNFILTKMINEKMSFDDALALAQKLGYAERNPSADVDGHDACRKICILASLAFGKHIYPKDVRTEGITAITPEDVQYCNNYGGAVKLIGWARKKGDKAAVMVCPAFISEESQLSTVNDVFNAILVRGDATGDVVFYGKGAGKLPTASAVVSDIIMAAKMHGNSISLYWEDSDNSFVLDYKSLNNRFYVRISANNKDNKETALKEAERYWGSIKILHREGEAENEAAFITESINEEKFESDCVKLSEIAEIKGKIRVLDY